LYTAVIFKQGGIPSSCAQSRVPNRFPCFPNASGLYVAPPAENFSPVRTFLCASVAPYIFRDSSPLLATKFSLVSLVPLIRLAQMPFTSAVQHAFSPFLNSNSMFFFSAPHLTFCSVMRFLFSFLLKTSVLDDALFFCLPVTFPHNSPLNVAPDPPPNYPYDTLVAKISLSLLLIHLFPPPPSSLL